MDTNSVILGLLVVLLILSSYQIYAINKLCKDDSGSEFYSRNEDEEDEEKKENYYRKDEDEEDEERKENYYRKDEDDEDEERKLQENFYYSKGKKDKKGKKKSPKRKP